MKFLRSITSLLVLSAFSAQALIVKPNVAPVVSNQIANYDQLLGTTRVIDLTGFFRDPDASAAAKLVTPLGTMNFTLDGDTAPITVANFLNYVNSGRYFKPDPNNNNQLAPTFFHRSATNPAVIQAGGYLGTVDSAGTAAPIPVTMFPPITNEPVISNKRSTIAMAKTSSPNSATSQWYINTADNTALDDPNVASNTGGFTVFGRVAGTGMTVADAIAALPKYNFGGTVFTEIPLRNYDGRSKTKAANLVSIPEFTEISPLIFSATSNNAAVAVTISGNNLLVTGKQIGAAQITVTATDLDGAAISQMFTVNVVNAPGRLLNIGTRVNIGTGDNVLIAGFLIGGSNTSKRLAVRAIGPSLQANIPNAISDPTIDLLDDTGTVIATSDNWIDSPQKQDLIDFHLNPSSDKEAALIKVVPSSSTFRGYTAVVKGIGNTSGVGVIEVYDLDALAGSTLLNLSSRGRVGAGDANAMYGGIISGGNESRRFVVRSRGPSLAQQSITGPLPDPMLQVIDANGTVLASNDDWQNGPNAAEIQADNLQPSDPKESAVAITLPPAGYTVKITGNGSNPTGVATVEIYQVQ